MNLIFLSAFILISLYGCAKDRPSNLIQKMTDILTVRTVYDKNREMEYQKASSMLAEIQGTAKRECSRKEYCKTEALGKKACGGPSMYIVYSSERTDTQMLLKKVNEYNAYIIYLQNKYEQNAISDCSIVTAPELECLNSVCTEIQSIFNPASF